VEKAFLSYAPFISVVALHSRLLGQYKMKWTNESKRKMESERARRMGVNLALFRAIKKGAVQDGKSKGLRPFMTGAEGTQLL
jgi:hypothetical protein